MLIIKNDCVYILRIIYELICLGCGGELKHRDYVKRIIKSDGGKIKWIIIPRLICCKCGKVHRQLPNSLKPFKHYNAHIIYGVINGSITSNDIKYEDYPCEMTMSRWKKSHIEHLI